MQYFDDFFTKYKRLMTMMMGKVQLNLVKVRNINDIDWLYDRGRKCIRI